MSAPEGLDLVGRPIDELVWALDAIADPLAADAARELVQRVLELHGLALTRIMAAIAETPDGARLTALLADDERVSGVLLLHGLHPADFESRVRGALDRLHAHLALEGVVVLGLTIDGEKLKLQVGPGDGQRYRSERAESIRSEIRQALFAAAPDASLVEIEFVAIQVSYVPVSSITKRREARDSAGVSH